MPAPECRVTLGKKNGPEKDAEDVNLCIFGCVNPPVNPNVFPANLFA
jgi:hypothetical protein